LINDVVEDALKNEIFLSFLSQMKGLKLSLDEIRKYELRTIKETIFCQEVAYLMLNVEELSVFISRVINEISSS